MRHLVLFVVAAVMVVGCETISQEAVRGPVQEKERTVDKPAMPSSDAVVAIDLASLTLQDMRLGDDFLGTADLEARPESRIFEPRDHQPWTL
jgi:hypothetical protein